MRHGALRVVALLGDVQRVLEADEGEEGEDRALQQQGGGDALRRRRLEQVDAAPVGGADGDHQEQPARLHHGAEDVHPHALADAAEHHAGDEQEEAEREQGRLDEGRVGQAQQVLGDHARLGGDGGEARHHHREPHHPGQQRAVEGAVRDVGGAARARVARAERGVGEAGEQRRHHGDDEAEPDGGAELPRGPPDQAVDARAEHAAQRVGEELERPDGAAEPVLLGVHGGADDGLAHGRLLFLGRFAKGACRRA